MTSLYTPTKFDQKSFKTFWAIAFTDRILRMHANTIKNPVRLSGTIKYITTRLQNWPWTFTPCMLQMFDYNQFRLKANPEC